MSYSSQAPSHVEVTLLILVDYISPRAPDFRCVAHGHALSLPARKIVGPFTSASIIELLSQTPNRDH